jgi:RNA methyltransferase, TrmH family
MLVKSQVKYIQSLGHKKFRDVDGVFVAEGPKIVQEFLQSDNLNLVECFATETWLMKNETLLRSRENKFIKLQEKELQRISFHPAPNEVVAVFSKPVFNNPENVQGVTLLLDNIQDPGNLGTLLRTADWFGVSKIVCSADTVDAFNPKVVQSAMGSLVRVELIYRDLEEYIRSQSGKAVYAASLDGDDLVEKVNVSSAFLLVGNESRGISSQLEALATRRLRIPRRGGAESLNVAVATGILLSMIEVAS